MKRTIIGGFIFLGGLLVNLMIIFSASIYVTSITEWSGQSKLWFAIFGAKEYGNDVVDSLFLGVPFIVGVVLMILGLIIFGYEYYKSFKK